MFIAMSGTEIVALARTRRAPRTCTASNHPSNPSPFVVGAREANRGSRLFCPFRPDSAQTLIVVSLKDRSSLDQTRVDPRK